ncbi:MAG: hypothetical protein EBX51_02370 [Acidimicrobiia bacterium]|nr:hypothetical protein [Acidimicrobiia bacterium]
MSDDNEAPDETPDDLAPDGIDPDELENLEGLEVDPDEIDDVESDAPDADVADVDVDVIDDDDTAGEAKTGETLPTDDERLNLDDSEEERPRRKSREDEDENELATADDQEEDLLKILEDKLRTSDDFAPEGEEPVSEADDSTDGTPLIQPRRPDEDHCQQCFLLVRKSAPKCPVDHDLCPKFPVA